MAVDIWEVLSDGGETRRVQDMNSEGTRGLSLPKDALDQHGVKKGDDLPVKHVPEDNKIEIYLP
jgi:hypothetical protein